METAERSTESFKLDIKEKSAAAVKFEFFAITGKTYTIERTADMKTWTPVEFNVGVAPATGAQSYQAADVRVVTAFTGPETGEKNFYRLTVR